LSASWEPVLLRRWELTLPSCPLSRLSVSFSATAAVTISPVSWAVKNGRKRISWRPAVIFMLLAPVLLLILICWPLAGKLAVALGSTPTILPYAQTFLQIIILGAPFMMSSLVLNNQLRFQGSAMYGMVGITSGAVLNIFLEPLLIFYCGLGIAGAAMATVFSQFVGMCVLLAMARRGGNLSIHWRKVQLSVRLFKEIVMGGAPSLFRQGLESVGTIVLNVAAGAYGDAAIAAMSIVNRLSFLAAAAMIGFGQGYQPVCGFNYGARIFSRVRSSFNFCLKSMAGCSLILVSAGFYLCHAYHLRVPGRPGSYCHRRAGTAGPGRNFYDPVPGGAQ
jgi:Na+-driven multidrug efflux pump